MDIGDLTYIKVKENHGDWEQAGKDILYTAIHLVPMVPVILLGVQYFKPKEKNGKLVLGGVFLDWVQREPLLLEE